MKDLTFQIEKMKTLRANSVGSIGKPAQVMIGLCDVVLEILAEMQGNFLEDTIPERESPPDREIRHPLTVEDRRKEVFAMLMVCSNELENKTLFPSLDQTEVALIVKSGSSEIIIKNASFLIQRIIETLEANK